MSKPKRSAKTAHLSPDRIPAHLALPLVGLLVVIGIVLITYWPALSAQANYLDDDLYLGSRLLQHPSWESVQRFFGEVMAPSAVLGYYHPLALVSVMLDFLDPAATSSMLPFHRTSLILHLLNVTLVVMLLYLLFDHWLTAGFLGLLYGLHPLNADAVLWVAERKTVLSTFFALAALIFYVLYVQRTARNPGGGWRYYGAALFMYLCAALSKPTTLPLAMLLPLLDYWPFHRLDRRAWLEKIPFLVLAGLFAVVTIISQVQTAETGPPDIAYMFTVGPLVVCYALVLYFSKLVWPVGLVADYPFPKPFMLMEAPVLLGLGGTLVLVLALAFSARRTRAWLTGGLFFLLAIFPALGIIPFTSSIAANRFVYLPMVGLLLPINWALNRLWNMAVGTLQVSTMRMILTGVGVILALGCIGVTRAYIAPWQDTVTLFQYYLTQTPNEWKLHNRLGGEWLRRGQLDKALPECIETVRLNPGWTTGHLNLGRVYFFLGRFDDAQLSFAAALQLEPNNWQAHVLMAKALLNQDDLEGALKEFQAAGQINPLEPEIPYDIAEILVQQGKLADAVQHYQHALQLNPNYQEARSALDAIMSQQPS